MKNIFFFPRISRQIFFRYFFAPKTARDVSALSCQVAFVSKIHYPTCPASRFARSTGPTSSTALTTPRHHPPIHSAVGAHPPNHPESLAPLAARRAMSAAACLFAAASCIPHPSTPSTSGPACAGASGTRCRGGPAPSSAAPQLAAVGRPGHSTSGCWRPRLRRRAKGRRQVLM